MSRKGVFVSRVNGVLYLLLPLLLLCCGIQSPRALTVLDQRISMEVYAAETLESVIFRLQSATGQQIAYTTVQLMPYKAKAAVYEKATVKTVLDEQLKGTRLSYTVKRKKLMIINKDTHSYSVSVPFPVRFGNEQLASIGAGLQFGIAF